MNFDLGPDELALRDGIRELCARRFPMERVRQGFDHDGWRALGDAGVFSLRLAGGQGGVGLGMTEAVIVFEELGRALVPGPLVATHLAAGIAEGAATGERVITLHDDSGLIEFGAESDAAMSIFDDKVFFLTEPGGETVASLDPLTPVVRTRGLVAGEGARADGARLRLEGTALTAALSSGIASRTVELAVAYAKERRQFGKPIGAFQAVKHICADMLVRAEVARAAVDAAGVLLDDDDAEAPTAVHTAKLLASEYAIQNAKACIQVHGGMGFTWEVDAHLYLKRAAVLATNFGGVDAQAELVAATL
jgi:alkylation response protein AidB-like acyl-CoA dehydrogenase